MSRSPALLLVLSLALAACGGSDPQPDGGALPDSGAVDSGAPDSGTVDGGAPTATFVLPDGSVMSSHDSVTVRFSEGMSRQTLQVGGALAANGAQAIWSTATQTDDTVQLAPAPQWPLGQGLSLTVDAQTPSGAHATASTTLTISDPFGVSWTQRPANPSTSSDAAFAFACDVSGCTFRCALDSAPLVSCTSPVNLTGVAEGTHTFHVEATHGADVLHLGATWTIDQTAPSLVSATFDGYGTLKLTFDEDVDASAAQDVGRYAIASAGHPALTVTSASASGAEVSLGLSGYQLPVDYALTASAKDLAGNERTGISKTLPGASNGSRVAFLSAAKGSGDLHSWNPANPDTGLTAADDVCQSEAMAAGLTGTFRAYLSDGLNDAACRARNLNGKVSAHCGQASAPPAGTSAWIDVTGRPLARNLEELSLGAFLAPLAYTADGTDVSSYGYSWLATDISPGSEGQVDGTSCSNWTSTTGAANSTVTYDKRIAFRTWATSSCSATDNGLMCFQVDPGGFALNDRYRETGKVAFVTSATTGGVITSNGKTGLAGADDLCQTAAANAGLANPTHFVAWLSDANADAYCRVLGASAKRSASPACGLASPPATGPWVSTTGLYLADDLTDLTSNGPRVPLFATETGDAPPGNAWTGTSALGMATTNTCGNWTSASGLGDLNQPPDAIQWSLLGSNACSTTQASLLCFER